MYLTTPTRSQVAAWPCLRRLPRLPPPKPVDLESRRQNHRQARLRVPLRPRERGRIARAVPRLPNIWLHDRQRRPPNHRHPTRTRHPRVARPMSSPRLVRDDASPLRRDQHRGVIQQRADRDAASPLFQGQSKSPGPGRAKHRDRSKHAIQELPRGLLQLRQHPPGYVRHPYV